MPRTINIVHRFHMDVLPMMRKMVTPIANFPTLWDLSQVAGIAIARQITTNSS